MRKRDWFFLGVLAPIAFYWLVSVLPAAVVWLIT